MRHTVVNPVKYGTCYEDAWRYLIKEEEGALIHGSLQLSAEGPRVNHAWVELPTGWVWEPQTKSYYTIEDFKMMGPAEERRYTVDRAAAIAARTGNFGPWVPAEHGAGGNPAPEAPTYYHSTEFKGEITKFKTSEVWFDTQPRFYGERDVIVDYKWSKPFVTNREMVEFYDEWGFASKEEAERQIGENRKKYIELGGESNPASFQWMREQGYDLLVDEEGYAALYPGRVVILDQGLEPFAGETPKPPAVGAGNPYLKAWPWAADYRYRPWWRFDGHWGKEEEGHLAEKTKYWAIYELSGKFLDPSLDIKEAKLYHKGKCIKTFTSSPLTKDEHRTFLYGTEEEKVGLEKKIKEILAEPPFCSAEPSNPLPEAKEPWQMTRAEHLEAARTWRQEYMPRLKGQALEDELRKVDEGHRRTVEYALAKGKPVPPEVLADYPDLARKANPPAVEEVPEVMELEDVGREWDKLTVRQRQPIVERANLLSSFAIRDWAELPLSKKDAIRMSFPKPPAVEGGNPVRPRTERERLSFHERIFGKGSAPPTGRLGRGQVVNDFMPMPPDSGPPLPRILGLKWPWKE